MGTSGQLPAQLPVSGLISAVISLPVCRTRCLWAADDVCKRVTVIGPQLGHPPSHPGQRRRSELTLSIQNIDPFVKTG